MKIQQLSGALAAVSLLGVLSSAAYGNTVVVDRIAEDQIGGVIYGGDTLAGVNSDTAQGGEFTLIPSDSTILNNYSSSAKVTDPDAGLTGQVGFESFCLETGLSYPIPPGIPTNPLNYAISPNILNASSYQPGLTITLGTAWLYSQFAAGSLTGYNYTNATSNFTGTGWNSPRADDAAYLQAAIWYLESQPGFTTFASAGGSSNPFLTLLTTPTTSGGLGLSSLTSAFASDPGGFNVDVINIGTAGQYQYQAQLVMGSAVKTTPDGGATVMMLGVAAGGLALLRRRLAA
jgi:hypothetical protein